MSMPDNCEWRPCWAGEYEALAEWIAVTVSSRSRVASSRASWAAVIDAQTVSPPTSGTSMAWRTVKAGGAGRKEKSLCQTPPKLNASDSVASLTTRITSG